MALSTFVGSFAVPAVTGNVPVNGIGFQPLVVIFFGNGLSANGASSSGTVNTGCPHYYGIALSSTSRVVIINDDDFSNIATVSSEDTTKCIRLNAIGVTKFAADFVSMQPDGFIVNFTTALATPDVVNFMALGGSDLTNAFLKTITSPVSTGNQSYTGVGFQPDALFLIGQVAANIHESMGAGTSSSARGAMASSFDGVATTQHYSNHSKIFSSINPAGSVLREADLVSPFGADGFTLNWTTVNATTQNVYVLCLKGGSYKAGFITQKVTTGTQQTSGIGFTPTGLLLFHAHNATSGGFGAALQASIGAASSPTARGVIDYSSNNFGVAELERDKIFTCRADDATPTLQGQADLTSFDSDGWTLNYGTTDGTAREIYYLAFGNTPAAAGSPFVFASSDVRARGRSLVETPQQDLLTNTLTAVVAAPPFFQTHFALPTRATYPNSLRTHAFWFNGTGEKPFYDFDSTMPRVGAYPSNLRMHATWFNAAGQQPFYNPDYPRPSTPYRQPVGFDSEAFALRNQPPVTTPLFQFSCDLPTRQRYPSELRTSIFWYVIDDNVPFELSAAAYALPTGPKYPPSLRDFTVGPRDLTSRPFYVPLHDPRGPYFRVRESPWPNLLNTILAPVAPPFFQRHFDLPTRAVYPNALRQHAQWFNGQGLTPFYIPDYPLPRLPYKQPVGFQYQSFAAQNVPFNPQWALNSNRIIGGVKTPPIDI